MRTSYPHRGSSRQGVVASGVKSRKGSLKQGTLSLHGDYMIVTFNGYSQWTKRYLGELKEIAPDASYHSERKKWKISIEYLGYLWDSKYLNPQKIDYKFDLPEAQVALSEYLERKKNATQRLSSNPFSVSEEDLELVSPALILRREEGSSLVVCEIGLRYSDDRKLAKLFRHCYFWKSRGAYLLTPNEVKEQIKLASSEKYNFGVEESCGNWLKESSQFRFEVGSAPDAWKKSDVIECGLVPVVYYDSSSRCWSLEGLPNSLGKKYRSKSGNLNEFSSKLLGARSLKKNIHICAEVNEFAAKLEQELESRVQENEMFNSSVTHIWQPKCYFDWNKNQFHFSCSHDSQIEQTHGVTRSNYCFWGRKYTRYSSADLESWTNFVSCNRLEAIQTEEYTQQLAAIKEESTLAKITSVFTKEPIVADFDELIYSSKLYSHQKTAISWMSSIPYGFLADDMGLGKTLSSLSAFTVLKHRGEIDFLFICSPSALVSTWVNEAGHWLPGLNVFALPRKKAQKLNLESSLDGVDVFVANFEGARQDYVREQIEVKLAAKNAMFIVDESQRAKNSQSKTFEALKSYSHLCCRRYLLSGTPTPRDISDIWAQMYLLDHGLRFGDNYYDWLSEIAIFDKTHGNFKVERYRKEEEQIVRRRARSIMIRRKKDDVVDLPPKIFSTREIPLVGNQQRLYRKLCSELKVKLLSSTGKSFERNIENTMEVFLRAVQLASNPRLVDPSFKGTPAKFLEMDEILSEHMAESDESAIVWTNYVANLGELKERYSKYGAETLSGGDTQSQKAAKVKAFQEGEFRLLVAIPAAAGVGLTLTKATLAVYLERTFNAEHWMQSIDRIYRIGQEKPVNIVTLISEGVDKLIDRNLKKKVTSQENLLSSQESELPSLEDLVNALN